MAKGAVLNYADAMTLIETHFVEQLRTTARPALKYVFDNVAYRPDSTSKEPWVKLDLLQATADQSSIGRSAVHRETGIVQWSIFTAAGIGAQEWRSIADVLAGIYRRACITHDDAGTYTFREPSILSLGVESGWHTAIFQAPFYRTKVLAAS